MKKKTLVLGASLKSERYSNMAIKRLRMYNHKVKAFGVKVGKIDDVEIDTVLKDYDSIDTVSLYLNPQHQKSYYDYIVGLKPKRVIFNPGTENQEFYTLLKANAIAYEEACTLVLLGTGQY